MAELEDESLKQLVCKGWKYHHATFDLYLKLSGVLVCEAAVSRVVLPEIRRLIQLEKSDDELRVRKANIDLSHTGLTDSILNTFLGAWQSLGISCCSLCLRLQRNRLTGASLLMLGQFVTAETIGTLEELHATHQMGPEKVTRSSVLSFLRKLSQSNKYPIWVKRRRCFRPVHLRLGRCGIENPEAIAGELERLVCIGVNLTDTHRDTSWIMTHHLESSVWCFFWRVKRPNAKPEKHSLLTEWQSCPDFLSSLQNWTHLHNSTVDPWEKVSFCW